MKLLKILTAAGLATTDAFFMPENQQPMLTTTENQAMSFMPNQPVGQMNPLMMYALMKDDSSKNSDLALMMMMMNMQGQGGSDMSAMLPILLLSRDDDKPKTTTAPTLAPKIQTMVNEIEQKNNLIKLIDEMGLMDLASIPTEWNLPDEPYSPETIDKIKETMELYPALTSIEVLELIQKQQDMEDLEDLVDQSPSESGQIPKFP